MNAFILYNSGDHSTSYGILICNNGSITKDSLQNKINEIELYFNTMGTEWYLDDILTKLPKEWKTSYFDNIIPLFI